MSKKDKSLKEVFLGSLGFIKGGYGDYIRVPSEHKKKLKEKKEELLKNNNQGVKKFFYGKNYVLARNQENADRKAISRGFIIFNKHE